MLKEQEEYDDGTAWRMIDELIVDVVDGNKQPEEALVKIHAIKDQFVLDQVDIQMFIEAGEHAQKEAKAVYNRVRKLLKQISDGGVKK